MSRRVPKSMYGLLSTPLPTHPQKCLGPLDPQTVTSKGSFPHFLCAHGSPCHCFRFREAWEDQPRARLCCWREGLENFLPPFSPLAQTVKNLPAMQEMQIRSLGWEAPLEEGMATQSSILAWRIPWTEEPGRLQSLRSQRVGHG